MWLIYEYTEYCEDMTQHRTYTYFYYQRVAKIDFENNASNGCILSLHSSYTHWVYPEYCLNFNEIILPLATTEGHSRVSERWEYRRKTTEEYICHTRKRNRKNEPSTCKTLIRMEFKLECHVKLLRAPLTHFFLKNGVARIRKWASSWDYGTFRPP